MKKDASSFDRVKTVERIYTNSIISSASEQTIVKMFHEIDHHLNEWVNDSRKILQRSALRQKRLCIETERLKNVSSNLTSIDNRSRSIKHETTICMIISQSSFSHARRLSQWHVNRQSTMYDTKQLSYWHAIVTRSKHLIDRLRDILIHFRSQFYACYFIFFSYTSRKS